MGSKVPADGTQCCATGFPIVAQQYLKLGNNEKSYHTGKNDLRSLLSDFVAQKWFETTIVQE
jgi:hypothetical protein